MVAVTDSGAGFESAVYVRTRILAWFVAAAVATTATAESTAENVVGAPALRIAVVFEGSIAVAPVNAVAAADAETTMLTSRVDVAIATAVPAPAWL
jgi:hypothetical protein